MLVRRPYVCALIFAVAVALGTCCAAQSTTDATQQSVTNGSNAPASTTAPSPANQPAGNGPTTAAPANSSNPTAPGQSTSPANSGSTAGSAFPEFKPSPAKPAEQSDMTTPASRPPADRDPLLDLPPLPKAKVSLQGGTLVRVDPVRDQILMIPFQGKREEIAFDVRTQFTQDGKNILVRDLKPGTPIYADTIWDGQRVFAKSVRIFTSTHQDQERAQILGFDAGKGALRVRDELFPEPVDLKVNNSTVIRKNASPGTVADLLPGSLVAIKFQPGTKHANQIDVLATPGAAFDFSGPVTHIDLLTHVIGISNRSDSIIYDIHFDPDRVKITKDLQEGADVDINATFDGTQYSANRITIQSARAPQ